MNHNQKQQACKVGIARRLKLGTNKIPVRLKPKVVGFAKRCVQIVLFLFWFAIVVLLVLFGIYGPSEFSGLIQTLSAPDAGAIFGGIAIIGVILVAAMQFGDARDAQRRNFVSEHVTKTFTHEDLRDTYYYLAYSYPAGAFWRIEKEVECLLKRKEKLLEKMFSIRKELNDPGTKFRKEEKKNDLFNVEKGLDKLREDMFQRLEPLQGNRVEGQRLYHPRLFQGSVEEKRLDSLLGYFNVIAYYYYSRPQTFTIKDLEGSIGFHIVSTCRNRAVAEYFAIINEVWENDRERLTQLYGERKPFSYLQDLAKDLEKLREK